MSDTSRESSDTDDEPQPYGDAIRKTSSRVQYKQLKIEKRIYSVGDTVTVASDNKTSPYVARIEQIFLPIQKENKISRDLELDSGLQLMLKWFYRPCDLFVASTNLPLVSFLPSQPDPVYSNVRASHLDFEREVIYSFHVDMNPASVILSAVRVIFTHQESSRGDYFCRYVYDTESPKLIQLRPGVEGFFPTDFRDDLQRLIRSDLEWDSDDDRIEQTQKNLSDRKDVLARQETLRREIIEQKE